MTNTEIKTASGTVARLLTDNYSRTGELPAEPELASAIEQILLREEEESRIRVRLGTPAPAPNG